MLLYGGTLLVYVDGGISPSSDKPHLKLQSSDAPHAYTYVELIGEAERYLDEMSRYLPGVTRSELEQSLHEDISGRMWLSSHGFKKLLLNTRHDDPHITKGLRGPAENPSGNIEVVRTLICSGPLPTIEDFQLRKRLKNWPKAETLSMMRRLPAILVCTGHREMGDPNIQFRMSWSLGEVLIINDIPLWIRQAYCAFKYTVKRLRKKTGSEDESLGGRSEISSYHLKTVLLYTMEETPPCSFPDQNTFKMFVLLLKNLENYLQNGNLPHYFDPRCDLLETLHRDELERAKHIMGDILTDPISAILSSITHPEHLFGSTFRLLQLRAALQRYMQSWDNLRVDDINEFPAANGGPELQDILGKVQIAHLSSYETLLQKDAPFAVRRPKPISLQSMILWMWGHNKESSGKQ